MYCQLIYKTFYVFNFFIYIKEETHHKKNNFATGSFFYTPQYRILDEDKDAKEAKEQEGHQEQQVVDGE